LSKIDQERLNNYQKGRGAAKTLFDRRHHFIALLIFLGYFI